MLNDLRDTFGYKIPELFPKKWIAKNPLDSRIKSCACEFWYDGQDAGTFTLNGVNVIQWDDKSGFGRHVTNAVDAQRPSYDAATGRVDFVKVNLDYLQSAAFGPLAQPNTIFILYKIRIDVANGYVFDALTSLNQIFSWIAGVFKICGSVWLADGVYNLNDNIHCAEFNGVNSTYWINGVSVVGPANAGISNLDGITLGSRGDLINCGDVEIMEVFGYNCIITPAERLALENYLTSKWSL